MEAEQKTHLTEDVLGEFGFRIKWTYQTHWTDFKAYRIIGRTLDGIPQFQKEGASTAPTFFTDEKGAEVYAEGYIKWDGCNEIDWGRNHLCGAYHLKEHIKLIRYLHDRAMELMGSNEDPWEEE